jgi:hypothetical protein
LAPAAKTAERLLSGLAVLCTLGLAWSMAHWLLVPRGELCSLALPHAEAYIYRTPRDGTWLLARSTGMTRSRNADTVESALRVRGINRLRGVVWLGGLPATDPLPRVSGPRFSAEQLAGQGSGQFQWLQAGRQFVGVELSLGRQRALVLYDERAGRLRPGPGPPPLLAILSARSWSRFDARFLNELSARCPLAMVDADTGYAAPRRLASVMQQAKFVDGLLLTTELDVRCDARGRLRLDSQGK